MDHSLSRSRVSSIIDLPGQFTAYLRSSSISGPLENLPIDWRSDGGRFVSQFLNVSNDHRYKETLAFFVSGSFELVSRFELICWPVSPKFIRLGRIRAREGQIGMSGNPNPPTDVEPSGASGFSSHNLYNPSGDHHVLSAVVLPAQIGDSRAGGHSGE